VTRPPPAPRAAGFADVTEGPALTVKVEVAGVPHRVVRTQRAHSAEESAELQGIELGALLRTIVVRPGVVYGRGSGIIGELFKAASNGLVRVVGDGNNHWPCIYDRDLADLYAKLAAREDAKGVYHANDEGDERVNDIVSAISPYVALTPDVRHVPIDEARRHIERELDLREAELLRHRVDVRQTDLRARAGERDRVHRSRARRLHGANRASARRRC